MTLIMIETLKNLYTTDAAGTKYQYTRLGLAWRFWEFTKAPAYCGTAPQHRVSQQSLKSR
jgi:hypothetical protein